MSVRRIRPILKKVYVDESEERMIRENMRKFEMVKFSTFARRVLLFPSSPIIQVDLSAYEHVIYELRRIGNNINQIAKIANQSKEVDTGTLFQLEIVVSELERYVKEKTTSIVKEVEQIHGSHKT